MAFANDCLDAGYSSLRAIPSVEVDQCTVGTARLLLRDPATGAPIDVSAGSSSSSSGRFSGVRVVMKELPGSATVWAQATATAVAGTPGMIEWDYSGHMVDTAGILTAETQFWQDGVMQRAIPFFFIVNPTLAGIQNASQQMLSVMEIRMTMRDVDPEANFLIDELDFSTNEIALMVRRCIDYWNEQPPPVATYSPVSFPYRYHLSVAVVAELHRMAAIHKMRNNLDYSAGGITVKDLLAWKEYQELGERLWARWAEWVKHKKYQLNIEGGIIQLTSGYQRDYFYR